MPHEKEKFFRELYALDDTDHDDVDIGLQASIDALNPPKVAKLSGLKSSPARTNALESSDRSGASSSSGVVAGSIDASQDRISDHNVSTSSLLATLKKATEKRPEVLSDGAIPRTDPNEFQTARKTSLTRDPRHIFAGFYFYFFVNNDIHRGRRFRIAKAVQFGAVWEKQWSRAVTHVIVDHEQTYEALVKYIGVTTLPKDIVVVNEAYPAECISHKFMVNPDQVKFRVKGAPEQIIDATGKTTATPTVSERSAASLQLKPATPAVQARALATPSQTSPMTDFEGSASEQSENGGNVPGETATEDAGNDTLDGMIEEAKKLQFMSLDSDEDQSEDTGHSSGDEFVSSQHATGALKRKPFGPSWQENFQCMNKNTGKNGDNPNAQIIALLEEMAQYYAQIKDEWRPIAYRKAIATLRNVPEKITTKEQARKLPFIGARLADKIEEIVYTNHLRRLENARAEPSDKILQAFLKIYGVGFAQATKWVEQGYKTLGELVEKANLTENQKIGIEHYSDFEARIPRDEVRRHGRLVEQAMLDIDKHFQVFIMGSYRRGSDTSGDIDLIITHPLLPLETMRNILIDKLVPRLFEAGFLKAALAATSRKDGTKWHGASALPGSAIWRRIDLLLVPRDELGAALIYFTGNDIFNRSLRLLASRKGMRLNQRGLYKDGMRGPARAKISEGELVEGRDEKKIFEALGVPWRPPYHRIC